VVTVMVGIMMTVVTVAPRIRLAAGEKDRKSEGRKPHGAKPDQT